LSETVEHQNLGDTQKCPKPLHSGLHPVNIRVPERASVDCSTVLEQKDRIYGKGKDLDANEFCQLLCGVSKSGTAAHFRCTCNLDCERKIRKNQKGTQSNICVGDSIFCIREVLVDCCQLVSKIDDRDFACCTSPDQCEPVAWNQNGEKQTQSCNDDYYFNGDVH